MMLSLLGAVLLLASGGAEPPADSGAAVARIGPLAIGAKELRESFETGPAFVRRLPDPVRRHLGFMINERLLALLAREQHLDTTAFVRERLAALEEDLAVDELYRREIRARVHLSDTQVDSAAAKERIQLRLRWLFAGTKGEAERLWNALGKGAPFDSLFARASRRRESAQVPEPGTAGSPRRLETTLLRLEVENPSFAAGIRGMKSQETRGPIPGPDGWYIVRLDEVWQDPLVTATAAVRLRADAEALLRRAEADREASAYVASLMRSAGPVIRHEGFNILRAYIAGKGLSREKKLAWKIPATFMTEAGPLPVESSGRFLDAPLAVSGGSTLSVRDFVRWYDIRQFQIKTSSLAAFNSSVKDLVWLMIRDRLLGREARARGLEREGGVRGETGAWEVKLLYMAARAAIGRSIEVPESRIRRRYEQRRSAMKAPGGKLPSYAEVRPLLREDLFRERERAVMDSTLRALERTHSVSVNEDRLRSAASGLAREPGAIEMILYKPGGTFPRVAYPSIDDEWQWLR